MVKKYDKIMIFCIIGIGACICALIILLAVNHFQKQKKVQEQIDNYFNDLSQAWEGDEYITYLYVGSASVSLTVNDDFLNLSNADMLDKAAEYVNVATIYRAKYSALEDGSYVTMHIGTDTGLKVIDTNEQGQLKIVKDEFQ